MQMDRNAIVGGDRSLWVRCFWGVLCVFLFHTFTNRYVNPLFYVVDAAPVGRLIASLGALAFFLLLLVAAYNRPELIKTPTITVAMLVCYTVGVAGMALGVQAASPTVLTVGGLVAGFGSAWARVLALVILIGLDDRACLSCVTIAMVAFYAIKAVVYALPDAVGTAVCALLVLVAFAVAYPAARPIIEEARPPEAPAVLALTEPRKFISLGHTFFVTLVAFNIACGFSVTFGAVDGVPYSSLFAMAPVIVAALWLFVSGKPHADTVYVVACLFIVAGLLLILIPEFSRSEYPNTLLASGINIFKMVLVVTLAAIARRNPVNALPVFAWGEFATSLGIWLGDAAGTGVEALWARGDEMGPLIVVCLILGFVAYNLFALRAFGFEKTCGTIEEYA